MANGTVCIDKETIIDMVRLLEEMQDKLESLELASDPKVMESLNKSKEQIKNRDFGDWNEL